MIAASPEIAEIAKALATAQRSMGNAVKDATNPAFRSRYADLASVREAVIGPLTTNGIACVQAPAVAEGVVSVETRLIHGSGQWLAATVAAAPKDMSPQSVGSCITYLRRYGLLALCGIAPDDDDGNGAQPQHRAPPQRREPEPPGEAHDAEFSDADRRAFMAALSERGLKYDTLKEFCAALGRPKPSAMGVAGRRKLVEYLDSEAGKRRIEHFTHTGEIATEGK